MLGIFSAIPMGKVTKSLLVCATPRSGSTLLCALLDGTGVAGRPQEFFERLASLRAPAPAARVLRRRRRRRAPRLLAPTDPGEPDRRRPDPAGARRGHDGQRRVRRQAHVDAPARPRRPARPRPPTPRCSPSASPTRATCTSRASDKVAQAVSLWRAVQTREWRAGDVIEPRRRRLPRRRDRPPGRPARRAGRRVARVVRRRTRSSRSRSATRSSADDPQAVVAGVSTALGAGPAEIPEPPLRRQGDDRSARWVERARARGAGMSVTRAATPRGRVDPHHARGRRRARAPGAAVLGRQGLDRAPAPRREGVPPRRRCRSRSCTSTPATTSPRCSSSATAGSRRSASS